MSADVLHFSEADFDEKLTKGLALVDFYADWCGPCRMMAPVLDTVAKNMDGKAVVGKLNVDESPAIAQKFGVQSIPTLVILKDGQEKGRLVGVQPEAVITAELNSAL